MYASLLDRFIVNISLDYICLFMYTQLGGQGKTMHVYICVLVRIKLHTGNVVLAEYTITF